MTENNFEWTDKLVRDFTEESIKKRIEFAVTHDFGAAPCPINILLQNFKERNQSQPTPTDVTGRIVAFRSKNYGKIIHIDSQLKNQFCEQDGKAPFISIEEVMQNYGLIWEIYSVKGKDNEIFSIGDKAIWISSSDQPSIPFAISKFQIRGDNILAEGGNVRFFVTDITLLTKAQPKKEYLFTTHDNKDIYAGMKFWYLWSDADDNPKETSTYTAEDKEFCKAYLKFSTKYAAQQYINRNKKSISYAELESWVYENKGNSIYPNADGIKLLKYFEEKVMS